ncbi:hypothetical protein ACTHGU_02715 [Chitinophagaceae bacterium MMS25-I14]
MKYFITVAASVLLLSSCAEKKEDKMIGTWQAIKLDNPQLNQSLADKKVFLDTVGSHTTPEMNVQLYGTADLDSIRRFMDGEIEEAKLLQEYTVAHTTFKFRKDKVAELVFGSEPDSANWYFDDDGALILDDMKLKGVGDKTKMDLITVNDTLLELRYTESGVTSTATFRREKNNN